MCRVEGLAGQRVVGGGRESGHLGGDEPGATAFTLMPCAA